MPKKQTRIAAIDLGTNTFHLIIADIVESGLHIVHKENHPVKLGENLNIENKIIPAAFERGLNCLVHFKQQLAKYKVQQSRVIATSAVRTAQNGQAFIEQVKQLCSLDIICVDGDKEATYIYEGVKLSGAIEGKSLIMDIGGGSTEFIFCDRESLYWKRSYEIGAARLMQKFFHSDPISPQDQAALLQHVQDTLKELISIGKEQAATTLIGSAGAFESFYALLHPDNNTLTQASAPIEIDAFYSLCKRLTESSHAERAAMKDLIPLRVDMIVMAALLSSFVCKELAIEKIKLSTFDLKMGVLSELNNEYLFKTDSL